MARNKTILVMCPEGHAFVTFHRIDKTFICPDCSITFTGAQGYIFAVT